MNRFYVSALAAGLLALAAPVAHAQALQPLQAEGAQVQVYGRVTQADRNQFTIRAGTLTFRVYHDNSTTGDRTLREGDVVRVSGRLVENGRIDAASIQTAGGGGGINTGFRNGRIGKLVDVNPGRETARINFGGQVWTAHLEDARLFGSGGRRTTVDALRPNMQVRVTGVRGGDNLVDASLLEVVRAENEANTRQTRALEGVIVSVDEDGRGFQLDPAGPTGVVYVETERSTSYSIGQNRANFGDLKRAQRVNLRIYRTEGDWIAESVQVLPGQERPTAVVEGRVVSIEENLSDFVIQVEGVGPVTVTTDEDTLFMAGNRRSRFAALRENQKVTVTGFRRDAQGRRYDGDRVDIEPGSVATPAAPGSITVFEGRVIRIEGNTIRMDLRGNDSGIRQVEVRPNTTLSRGLDRIRLSDLDPGARIRVRSTRQGDNWIATSVRVID